MKKKLIKLLLKELCSLDGVRMEMTLLHNRFIIITQLLINEGILLEDETLNHEHKDFSWINKYYEKHFC
jgi:hypothetical protein